MLVLYIFQKRMISNVLWEFLWKTLLANYGDLMHRIGLHKWVTVGHLFSNVVNQEQDNIIVKD
jgi:hypothetical protein